MDTVYPARCMGCGDVVDTDFGLCGPCWRDTAFIGGAVCDRCGVPLPGDVQAGDAMCDGCLKHPKPWDQGRAAILYRDAGRKLVLALKHGDRQEIARPAAKWMAQVAKELVDADTLIAPIPLHWARMMSRRYNQSALLARALGVEMGKDICLDLLSRPRRTRSLDGLKQAQRQATLEGAITVTDKRLSVLQGRSVLLVDDVMTSGATLSAATHALQRAGAGRICVVVLARVTQEA
ncbi:MAG: ComF family protein [Pseudomonadota bacterium]